jgi:hypothetical protein
MSAENGGPAFPGMKPEAFGQDSGHVAGMTLRDYAVIKFMASILAWPDGPSKRDGETYAQATARIANEFADAMLEARK